MIEETVLYGGDIILEFDSAKHTYRAVIKGRRYKVPSVTGVCSVLAKPALIPWAVNSSLELCKGAITPGVEYSETYLSEVWDAARKSSTREKSEAGAKGTAIHKAIEASLRRSGGTEDPLPEVTEVVRLLEVQGLRVTEVERKVYSRRHRYSGTLDALAETDKGELVLLDWKTSKAVYPEFRLQTAAYQAAYSEETQRPISSRLIVQISPDGIVPHPYNKDAFRRDFAAFLAALRLYRHLARIKKS